jgi:hypothetical protein
LSSNDTRMAITICYSADDPKMMIQVLSRSWTYQLVCHQLVLG